MSTISAHLQSVSPTLTHSIHSRPSSRSSLRSFRAPSPSFPVDNSVAIRNRISTLKHTIRHQQAQLQSLESIITQQPARAASPLIMTDQDFTIGGESLEIQPDSNIAGPSSYRIIDSPSTKAQRRSSFEILHGMAGRDSLLPLPKKDGSGSSPIPSPGSIREGVPLTFGAAPLSPPLSQRASSPTRTLSRIPISSVGHARALAEEGQTMRTMSASTSALPADMALAETKSSALSSSISSLPPPSPNRRISVLGGGGNTTKVLADLQAGVSNARNALENTKAQLRLSQRTVASLTRQTEDLKESRERLRLENETLNNVVARKERLLQEVLERARKAEAEAATLKTQLKSETATTKKTLREMEAQVLEATSISSKSEREYHTLRDSVKHLSDGWKTDVQAVRDEMRKREAKWQKENEDLEKKYKKLLAEIRKDNEQRVAVKELQKEHARLTREWEAEWLSELSKLRLAVNKSGMNNEQAQRTALDMLSELGRIKRMMKAAAQIAAESTDAPEISPQEPGNS